MAKKYLRRTDIQKRYGIGRSTVNKWVCDGILPTPVKIGKRLVAWDEATLDRLDAERERHQREEVAE